MMYINAFVYYGRRDQDEDNANISEYFSRVCCEDLSHRKLASGLYIVGGG